MKRFIVRKIKQYAYTRQGWRYKDCGYVFAIYDREWKKNLETEYGWTCDKDLMDLYKYVENSPYKAVAQFWANWLNANRVDSYGEKIRIPMNVYSKGLDLCRCP